MSATERSGALFGAVRPITRRSLADEVREQLAHTIRSGALSPGAQLPREESLCHQFEVSRTSVREAIRDLITLGLVERRGNRAHVVEHLPEVRLDDAERAHRIREVFETRRLIEVQLTEYAAMRATDEQRAEIVDLAERLGEVTTLEDMRTLDRAFHAVVAAAAGNVLLAELHAKVLDAVFNSPRYDPLLRDAASREDAALILRETKRTHTAIATAIAAADPVAAGVAAATHLADVESRVSPP